MDISILNEPKGFFTPSKSYKMEQELREIPQTKSDFSGLAQTIRNLIMDTREFYQETKYPYLFSPKKKIKMKQPKQIQKLFAEHLTGVSIDLGKHMKQQYQDEGIQVSPRLSGQKQKQFMLDTVEATPHTENESFTLYQQDIGNQRKKQKKRGRPKKTQTQQDLEGKEELQNTNNKKENKIKRHKQIIKKPLVLDLKNDKIYVVNLFGDQTEIQKGKSRRGKGSPKRVRKSSDESYQPEETEEEKEYEYIRKRSRRMLKGLKGEDLYFMPYKGYGPIYNLDEYEIRYPRKIKDKFKLSQILKKKKNQTPSTIGAEYDEESSLQDSKTKEERTDKKRSMKFLSKQRQIA